MLLASGLYGQSCPSSCSVITSGPLMFCKCQIYEGGPSDRIHLVTDKSVTIVDVDRDGLRDIPFSVWDRGATGVWVLQQISPGVPGTFVAHRLSTRDAYGMTNIGDINGDSVEDFAYTTHRTSHEVYLLLSGGSFPGTYTDIFIFSGGTPNSIVGYEEGLYWSNYDGTVAFYDYVSSPITRNDGLCGDGITFADFNNDGYQDAACSRHGWATSNHGLYVYYFNGSSFYTLDTVDRTDRWQGVLAYDINEDGFTDLVAVSHRASVWINDSAIGWHEIVLDSNLSRGLSSSDLNPFARLNLADLDCDGDMDVIAATSCPPSGEAPLKWYEQVDTNVWIVHNIDFSGSNCDANGPYPYGVRVGILDETTHVGTADIVAIMEGGNKIFAYYNITDSISCIPLGYDDGTSVDEHVMNLPQLAINYNGLYLQIESLEPIASVSIYTADGYRLIEEHPQTLKIRISLRDLPKGVYVAVIESGKRRTIYRFVRLR